MDKKPQLFKHQFNLTWSQIVLGIATILMGVVLLIWPDVATALVINLIGIALIITGLVHVIRYFTLEAKTAIASNDLSVGLVWIVGGVLLMIMKGLFISLVPVFFGLAVLIGGVVKIQGAFDFHRMNAPRWYLELVSAIVSIVLGALILFNPFSTAMLLMRIIGASLVLEGTLDMVSKNIYEKTRKAFFVETKLED